VDRDATGNHFVFRPVWLDDDGDLVMPHPTENTGYCDAPTDGRYTLQEPEWLALYTGPSGNISKVFRARSIEEAAELAADTGRDWYDAAADDLSICDEDVTDPVGSAAIDAALRDWAIERRAQTSAEFAIYSRQSSLERSYPMGIITATFASADEHNIFLDLDIPEVEQLASLCIVYEPQNDAYALSGDGRDSWADDTLIAWLGDDADRMAMIEDIVAMAGQIEGVA
jgi:hypothetical protein